MFDHPIIKIIDGFFGTTLTLGLLAILFAPVWLTW